MADRRGFRSLLIGVDGSAGSRRAVAFVSRLAPPPRGRATVICVLEPTRQPSVGLLPNPMRAGLAGQIARLEAARQTHARREVEAAAIRLRKAGWRARARVVTGLPIVELLGQARTTDADLLVVGARGTRGIQRFLLGSVADAAAKRAPISVLIVR